MREAFFTVDVENDLHTHKYLGITEGLPRLSMILKKHGIKATLFVTGDVMKKYPKILLSLFKEGHKLGLHGYTHKRFDSLDLKEKEKEIKDSIKLYKKIFKIYPQGFRAPQHSIDKETLTILQKYDLKYDSSVCSKNLILLRHLIKRNSNKTEIIRNFLAKSRPYKLSNAFLEVPKSSPLISVGGFELKVYPKEIIILILKMHKLFNIPLNFAMHSWDMIDTPGSRTSRICSGKEFELILDYFIKEAKKRYKFVQMDKLI